MTGGVIPARDLPVYLTGAKAPLWCGMVLMLAIEATVFSSLIMSYFYLRAGSAVWPADVEPPELLLPTINTFIIIASALAMHFGDKGIRKGRVGRLRIGQTVALVLAIAFLVIKGIEYSHMPYSWKDHACGSITWMLSGFHAAHVLAVVLKGIVVAALAWLGYFNAERRLGVQINSLYWQFVVVVWLPIYFTLYISPRVL